ncbi:hypothetical protein FHX37_2793 [Haloactinospora alba]|uniref:Tetratricopeptide repeat protein n=1 Tax=Haloactinospora alba TaxID=405555 RepID=A0A543NLV9_9ACTN|nr:hypothetical protein [Haloactinospora alba]TQN32810.1 hypothetical protein FHX37_2793 [Haloactinospora alba]
MAVPGQHWPPPPPHLWPRVDEFGGRGRSRDHTPAAGELRGQVREAGMRGGFVLVPSGPGSADARAVFEALRAELPDWPVLAPHGGADLTAAPADPDTPYVLWLGDVTGRLGSEGVEPATVGRLLRAGAVVAATLDTAEYGQHRHDLETSPAPHLLPPRRVLGMLLLTMARTVVPEPRPDDAGPGTAAGEAREESPVPAHDAGDSGDGLPLVAWRAALDNAATPEERFLVGRMAHRAGRGDLAESAWQQPAMQGEPRSLTALGNLLTRQGRAGEAEALFTSLARRGFPQAERELHRLRGQRGSHTRRE